MKTLFLAFMLLPFAANAQVFESELTGFNFTYSDPKGSGTAESFFRNMKRSSGAVEVEVEKNEAGMGVIIRGSENHEFLLKDLPSFVKDARAMDLQNMNMSLRQEVALSLDSGEFTSDKDELGLYDFSLGCSRVTAHKEVMNQVLDGCVNKLRLNSGKFSSRSSKALLASIVPASFKGKDLTVKNLEFTSNAGDYKLEADLKADVSGKVKSTGKLSYDAGTGILTVKISEVKFGLFSVKKIVFDELKKKEDEKLKVKEPYVYYKIK